MAEGFSIAQGFVDILSRIDRSGNRRNAEQAGDEAGASFVTRMGAKLVSGISGSILPAAGAALQLGLAAAPAVAAAGAAIWQVGAASVAAAPAVLALGVAFKITALAVTALLPAVKESLSPISTEFEKTTVAAGKLASAGIKPLAQEFVKVNFPMVNTFMGQIAKSMNLVVKSTLGWLNTSRGQQAITNILGATGAAVQRLAPYLSSVATSFIAMIGRIAGVSLAAGEGGLTGILKKLEMWMDRVTAESVQGGLDKLKQSFLAVKGAVETVAHWIGVAIGFYRQYKTEIMLISDVLGIMAIVFGGPVTAIIALIGLVIRHIDFFRGAYESLKAAFASSTEGPAFLNNLKAAADIVVPALVAGFKLIWATIGPTLSKIFNQIKTQLIPAFGEFIAAAAPLVKFFIERLAPVIANAMNTVLNVISGVITIITGIFKVFTGLLRGNWSQVWEGIKQILRGAVSVLVSLVRGLVTAIKLGLSNLGAILAGLFSRAVNSAVAAFKAIVGKVKAVAGQAKSALISVFSNAGQWLVNAGSRIIGGLISGVKGKIGELRGVFNSVTGLIPDWKGPPEKDEKLLTPAGQKIMGGLLSGIRSQLPALRKELGGITAGVPGMAVPAQRSAPAGGQPSAGNRGMVIQSLQLQLKGVLDPTDPASTRRMVAALYEMLSRYEKGYT